MVIRYGQRVFLLFDETTQPKKARVSTSPSLSLGRLLLQSVMVKAPCVSACSLPTLYKYTPIYYPSINKHIFIEALPATCRHTPSQAY